jgi:hypothetical protein
MLGGVCTQKNFGFGFGFRFKVSGLGFGFGYKNVWVLGYQEFIQ